jgi:hypothetical protein
MEGQSSVAAKETHSVEGEILYQYGAYAVVKTETDYKVLNVEQNIVEEETNKLFEAIRAAKLYDKFLEEALAYEPPSFLKDDGKGDDETTPAKALKVN